MAKKRAVSRSAHVYSEHAEVERRLAQLGVSPAWLREAALQGELQRLLMTNDDLPGADSYVAASRGLRTLRVEARNAGTGWHNGDHLGIPVTFNPDESLAINVTAGDENTGVVTDVDPVNKSIKGPATLRAATGSRRRIPYGRVTEDLDELPVSFWYLLTYSGEELRVELSSPKITDDTGRVAQWSERILIGRVDRNPAAAISPNPVSPDVDFDVTRKPA